MGMTVEESVGRFGLEPKDEDLPQIRALLAQEAEAERRGGRRAKDLALLCCVQLFNRGNVEDSLLIWDAKQSGFDLGCYLDMQLLCGAGIEVTLNYLVAQVQPAAKAACTCLIEYLQAGDFDHFSPESYKAQYYRYFGVSSADVSEV